MDRYCDQCGRRFVPDSTGLLGYSVKSDDGRIMQYCAVCGEEKFESYVDGSGMTEYREKDVRKNRRKRVSATAFRHDDSVENP